MDLTALFSHSRTALLLCAEDRRIIAVNAAASALLREAPERVAGRRVEDLVVGSARAAAARELASIGRPGGAPGWLPIALRTAGGAPLPAELTWRSRYLPGRHLVALRPAPDEPDPSGEDTLTERESEILSRVARGQTGPEIAEGLFLSTATVERQVAAALRRLGARNRAHGIAIAVRTGQLDADLAAPDADGEPAAIHRLALEALDDPAALLDEQGRAVVANAAWRTAGPPDRRLVFPHGENYLAALERAGAEDPDAAQAVWGIREVLDGHVAVFVLAYRPSPEDDHRWFELRAGRYGGDPRTLLVRHRDVTGRRDAALGSALLDEVDAAVAFADLDGTIAAWRPSAERMLGVSAADAVGRPLWEVSMEPRNHDVGRSVLAETARLGRWAGELALVTGDGTPVPADVRLRVIDRADAAPPQIVAAAMDVSDRVASVRQTLEAREQLAAVTASMREGCLVLDVTGRICSVNPAVTTLLGWADDELVGHDMHEVLRSPLPWVAPVRRVRDGPAGPIGLDCFVNKDGHEVHVEYTEAPFAAADGSERWALVFRAVPVFGDPGVEGPEAHDPNPD